ncbi:MAG: MG2 domain-containing protein [Candidatus Hinthialibacter antarcticus]|nr:MG2 domain-containing protein [Candidatus Hinthialibacter antarcticus]
MQCLKSIQWLSWVLIVFGVFAPFTNADTQSFIETRSDDYLNVVGRVPLQAESLLDTVVVFFDRALDPASIPEIQDASPISFYPELSGDYRIGPNYIAFYAHRVDAETALRVVLPETLRSSDGKILNPSHREFWLRNTDFRVKRVWHLSESQKQNRFGLSLTLAPDQDSLREKLKVLTPSGQSLPVRFRQGQDKQTFILTAPQGPEWPITLRIDKGLQDVDHQVETATPFEFVYPQQHTLRVTALEWADYVGEKQRIHLRFSQPIDSTVLQENLQINNEQTNEQYEAEVKYSGSGRDRWVDVSMPFLADVTLNVRIAKELHTERGVTLHEDYQSRLRRSTDPLRIQSNDWRNMGKDGQAFGIRFNKPLMQYSKPEELMQWINVTPELPNLRISYDTWDTNEIRVLGEWKLNESYEIRFLEGLPHDEGVTLTQPVSVYAIVQDLSKWLGIGYDNEYYLLRRDNAALPIETRNVESLEVSLFRLFPTNLPMAMSEINNGQGSYQFNNQLSEFITTKHVAVSQTEGVAKTLVGLDELMPDDRRGVFGFQVSAKDYGSQTKIILYSNLGVLAHWTQNELIAFVHDLESLAPLASTRVTLYSNKHQVLAEGRTDRQGIVRLSDWNQAYGQPAMIVAENNRDFTFLKLDQQQEGTRAIDQSAPLFDREAYDAFLYADRELYRPGETVHLRWIARANYGDALAKVPLQLVILKPNGKELLTQAVTLSDFGGGEIDLETQPSYPTGNYRAELRIPGGNRLAGAYSFSLEEFVPNRMKAEVQLSKTHWRGGEENEVTVKAMHLFGAPAAGRDSEAALYFRKGGFQSERWTDYRFDNDSNYTPESKSLGRIKTDPDGFAKFVFSYEPDAEVTFPLTVDVVGRVFELGGRAVQDRKSALLLPSETMLGMSIQDRGDSEIVVHAAAIQSDETPASLERVTVTLEREMWSYYVRRYYGRNEPNWTRSFTEIQSIEIDLNEGRGQTAFNLDQHGYYRVRVHSASTPMYSSTSVYRSWRGVNVVDSSQPSLVRLLPDKERYQTGDVASVRIEAPFDGLALVTLQSDSIHKMLPVPIENGVGTLDVPLGKNEYPNLWVEATVIHHVENDAPLSHPYSSFAMASLRVDDPQRKLRVDILNAPDEIRPNTTISLDLETRSADAEPAQAEVTVALVDEGIHTITNYQTPDPLSWLGRPRKPEFNRAHYYDRITFNPDRIDPGGGSMRSALAKRVSSDLDNWIKPLALWSGTVTTDADGRASVEFDVPQFNGSLRLVVIACNETATGAAAKNILVRQPYMLRASLPRFLLPDDAAQARMVVFNHSDETRRIRLQWQTLGALQHVKNEYEFMLNAHNEKSFQAPVQAGAAVGQGELRWVAIVEDEQGVEIERLEDSALLPVRPSASFQSRHELRILPAGERIDVRNQFFIDDARTEIELSVGANPALQLYDALSYVIQYPYGCVEQTTSRLMPMYLLRKNSALMKTANQQQMMVKHYIQAGIDRLFSMQTPSGGLSYWPGDNQPYPYGSIYALHFLTLVENDRELQLPKGNLDSLKQYVRELAADWAQNSQQDLYRRAYALFTLALGGDAWALRQIPRFDDVKLPTAARYLLAAALAKNTQDRERVALYLSEAPAEPYLVSEQDGNLNSDIRNRAIELMALQQIGAEPERCAQLAQRLTQFLKNNRYGTTQETAFIVTALAEYIGERSGDLDRASARIEPSNGAFAEIRGDAVYQGKLEGAGASYTIINTGQSELFLNSTTRGVPQQISNEPVSEGLTVSRQFYTSEGDPFDAVLFNHGGSYVIAFTIECEQEAKNVIAVDRLPAGFEVENPRLDPNTVSNAQFESAVSPSYLDIRDDRVVMAFNQLPKGTHHFYYAVRAVTPGVYQLPPAQAECMYDPAVNGRSKGSRVEVK